MAKKVADDLTDILRLKSEHDKAIKENEEKKKSWGKFKADYDGLLATLSTLPDKLQYDIMVPVGSIAFLPGKLIHTNDVMVLLGENWFAQRSAKQAFEIVERRMQYVDKHIAELEQEHTQLKSYLEFIENFDREQKENKELKEIKEEIPDDDVANTKTGITGKKRVARQPKHNKVPEAVKLTNSVEIPKLLGEISDSQNSTRKTDEELFKRLEELEREEEESERNKHEIKMQKLLNEDVERTKHVTFIDESPLKKLSKDSGYIDSDDDSTHSDEEIKETLNRGNGCITFNHSGRNIVDQGNAADQDENSINLASERDELQNNESCDQTSIISPADIYDKFASISDINEDKPLKSILKEKRPSSENIKLKPILKNSPEHKLFTPDQATNEKSSDEPKSILKSPQDVSSGVVGERDTNLEETVSLQKSSNDDVRQSNSNVNEEPKSILKPAQDAFSGVVVERDIKLDEETPLQNQQLKPVSRFKASRMKKK